MERVGAIHESYSSYEVLQLIQYDVVKIIPNWSRFHNWMVGEIENLGNFVEH